MGTDIRFHITVKGIVVFNDKVLLMKRVRPSTDGLGFWELPGGGLEYGESAEDALKRELKEETGLTIRVIKPAYTFTKVREDYQTVGIGFLAIPEDDHVIISHEHTDYRFCTLEEAKELLNVEIYNNIEYTVKEFEGRV